MELSATRTYGRILAAVHAGLLSFYIGPVAASDDCLSQDGDAVGRIVSALNAYFDGGAPERAATVGLCVYRGDALKTGADGSLVVQLRAASADGDATTQGPSVVRLGPNSSVAFSGVRERSWVLELVDGWFRFFSGQPAYIDVDTAYITAGVRGTEFTLFTDRSACPVVAGAGSRGCSALWVQSGTVFPRSPGTDFGDSSQIEVFSSRDELRFDGGAAGDDNGVIAFAGVPPRRVKLTVSPDDAVDWAVYYPPLVRFAGRFCGPPGSQPDAADVEAVIRCGDAQTFAARVGPLLDAPREMAPDTRLLAALRLVNVGDIARARRVLEAADDADSLALRGLIALKGNERHAPDDEAGQSVARTYAQRAIDRDPASVNARLVVSYVEQAEFELAEAVAQTEQAARHADASDAFVQALVKARLAELALANQDTATALEHTQAAIDAAQRAADADTDAQPKVGGPVLARAYAVQGFAQLVALRADSAQQSFENAVGADNLLPLARLGLGLAMIRQSDLDAGVGQLELAVALDPEVSLYRSYLGKGYFEQRRPELAEKQYTLAKQLDDNDPTPWLYEAVLESAANDPITALSALEESKQRNDRRAVYRSRLLLDSDEAARNANLGQVYQALGFDQLARLEATRSLQSEPGSFAAHRLLTEANARRPRFEIARVSDLLQARLRAPRAQHPFSAQIADTRVDSPLASGSIVPGFNEYSRLFAYDGMRITASALVGSQQTLEEELLFSWAGGPASAAITQYKFDTDGFRPNNDEDKDYWSFLGQYRLTPSTSIQLDYRNLNFLHGDNFRGFDPNDYFSTDDIDDTVESWRVGGHHVFSADTDLVAFSHREDASAVIDDGLGFFFARTTETGTQHEAQLISRWPNANVVAGLGWYDRERDDDTFTPFGFTIESLIDSRTRHGNGYVYVTIGDEAQSDKTRQSSASSIGATLGVAYEDYEDERDGRVTDFPNIVFFPSSDLQRKRVLPKLGLMWQTPIATDVELTARGAYFRTLKRALVGNQTLEPTSVVGFNQFYDDPEATLAKVKAVGIDVAAPEQRWYAGADIVIRDLNVTAVNTGAIPFGIETNDIDEATISAYLNLLPTDDWAVAVRFERERFDRSVDAFGAERLIDVDTDRLTLKLQHFASNGLTLFVEPNWVRQDGTFFELASFAGPYQGRDDFWVVNAGAQYRLPGRRGTVGFVLRNLLDESFRYQDTDPLNPRFAPERGILIRASLNF